MDEYTDPIEGTVSENFNRQTPIVCMPFLEFSMGTMIISANNNYVFFSKG